MRLPPLAFCLCLVTALLAGCQAPPQISTRQYDPARDNVHDSAIVYIIRPAHRIGSATSPYILIDGVRVVDLPNDAFFRAAVTPGKRTFSAEAKYIGQKKWAEPATFDLEAGKVYFLRFYPDGEGGTAMIYGAATGGFYASPDSSRVKHPFEMISKAAGEGYMAIMREAEPISVTRPEK